MAQDRPRLLYIFNPAAGKGQGKQDLFSVVDTFTKLGWLVTAYPTQGKVEASRIAARYAGDFERVVCCGGDGTLGEVVNGLLHSGSRPPLGYIPAGSANDFAVSHALPFQPARAARVAVEGDLFPCDMGCFNGRYYTYIAAFGLFTDVSYETPQEAKNLLGHLAYILQGMTKLHAVRV